MLSLHAAYNNAAASKIESTPAGYPFGQRGGTAKLAENCGPHMPTSRRTLALIDWRSVGISAQGSDFSLARRSGTVSTVKSAGLTPFSSSSQNSGVATGAPLRARGE